MYKLHNFSSGLLTPAIQMTAAASGSNGITVADDDDIDFGTGAFFLHWEGSLPDWTPSTFELIRKTPSSADSGYALYIDSSPAGRLLLSLVNGGVAELQINSTVATGVADGGIAKITVAVVRETASVAGSATFYLNGAILGAAVAITAGAPYSISNALSMYVSGSATRRTASNTISCIVGNFAPTASEVLDLCTNGIPASWKWGSQASAVSGSALNGTSTRAFSSFSGSSTGFVASNAYSATARMGGWSLSVTAGYKYRAKFDYTISTDSGTVSGFVALRASRSDITLKSNDVAFASGVTSLSGSAVIEVTATETGSFFFAFLETLTGGGAGNVSLTIANAEITRLGATMALLPDAIPTSSATTWSDTSGNTGGGTLPAAGATKVTIRR